MKENTIEVSAKNLDVAIKKAAKRLKLEKHQIRYEIDTKRTDLFNKNNKKIVIFAYPNQKFYHEKISPFLNFFLKNTRIQVDFTFERRKNIIEIIIKGKDRKLFEKKDGELMIAFQYILNKTIGEKEGLVVKVDTNKYFRKNKERKLKKIVKIAKEKLDKKDEYISKKLNPYDRKFLHIEAEKNDLKTKSIGDRYYKKIKFMKHDSQ